MGANCVKTLKISHFYGIMGLMKGRLWNMNFISGNDRSQTTLLPDSIDDYVDENNSVRVIDAYIDSLDLTDLEFSKSQPNDTGRPMYNPGDLLKLYVYGYMNKIRSSRRLETETKRNLEVIWLLRKLSPDHKTIARFRHDNTIALKNVFRDFVKLCMKLNLYGKELVAVDGSKFKAVNSKDRNFGPKKLEERISRIDAKIEEYLKELEDSDWEEDVTDDKKSTEEIARIITELAARKELYQSYCGRAGADRHITKIAYRPRQPIDDGKRKDGRLLQYSDRG